MDAWKKPNAANKIHSRTPPGKLCAFRKRAAGFLRDCTSGGPGSAAPPSKFAAACSPLQD